MSITLTPEIDAYAYMDSRTTTIPAWWQQGGWIKGHPRNYWNGISSGFYLMAANTPTSVQGDEKSISDQFVVQGTEKPLNALWGSIFNQTEAISDKEVSSVQIVTSDMEEVDGLFKFTTTINTYNSDGLIKTTTTKWSTKTDYSSTIQKGKKFFFSRKNDNNNEYQYIGPNNKWYDFWINLKLNKPVGSQGKIKNLIIKAPIHESNGHVGLANLWAFATTDQTAYFGGVEYNKVSRPRALNELVENAPTDDSILSYSMSSIDIKNETPQQVAFYFDDFPIASNEDSIKINFKTTKFCLINYPPFKANQNPPRFQWEVSCEFSQDYSIKYYNKPYGTADNEVFHEDGPFAYSDAGASRSLMSKEDAINKGIVSADENKPYFYCWQDKDGKLYAFGYNYQEQEDLELYPVFYEAKKLSEIFTETLYKGKDKISSDDFHFTVSAKTSEYDKFLDSVRLTEDEPVIPIGVKLFDIRLTANTGYSFNSSTEKLISDFTPTAAEQKINIEVYLNKYLITYNNIEIGKFYYGDSELVFKCPELSGDIDLIHYTNEAQEGNEINYLSMVQRHRFTIDNNIGRYDDEKTSESFSTDVLVDFNDNEGIPEYIANQDAFNKYPRSIFEATHHLELAISKFTPIFLAYKQQAITPDTIEGGAITINYNISKFIEDTALIYLSSFNETGELTWQVDTTTNKLTLFLFNGTKYELYEGDGTSGLGQYNFFATSALCNKYYSFIKNGTLAQFYIPNKDAEKKVNSSFKLKGSYTLYEVPVPTDEKQRYYIKSKGSLAQY